MIEIFAHRGSSGTHPENTFPAYEEAVSVGADGLELDAQMSKDGYLVVLHDERIDRVTNYKGWVKDYTLAELQSMHVKGSHAADYPYARIPALADVLDWAQSHSLQLNIELKTGVVTYPHLEEHVLELIAAYHLQERTILSSFNHYTVQKVKQIAPEVTTALLFMEGLVEPWHYARSLGAAALHCHWPVVSPHIVNESRKFSVALRPFTINKHKAIYDMIQMGCAGIFTDFPEKAIQIRREIRRSGEYA